MTIRYLFMSVALLLVIRSSHAQIITYDLKKGQAFDILYLDVNPDANETMKRYFETVIPIGVEYGYRPQKGFQIKEPPLQGNYWPELMIIGLWENFQKREEFVQAIVDRIPDFPKMRREIWSTFFLTYWKVEEDRVLEIDNDKYNVVTAYWSTDEEAFLSFNQKWVKEAKNQGGELLLTLTDGTSPFGYLYDPEFLTITSWESKKAFDAFYAKNLEMNHKGVRHVNQFIIE